jgi:ectoine hydroxylase-related dioxygenase (phytanoyl-CoA dioxygenase family)
MTARPAFPPKYLAHTPPDQAPIQAWVEQFNREGYLFLPNVLPPEVCEEMRGDLDRALGREPDERNFGIRLHTRMFESSRANLKLFDLEPIVTFAEKVIAPDCHVMHNNSFISPTAGGGIAAWHQDDAPHLIVTQGEPPTNIMMPCLLFTVNYYLTGVETVANGPTEVVPGSHLFGRATPRHVLSPGDARPDAPADQCWEGKTVSCLGPAGSAVIFNNQVWHRGAPNTSDRARYITQVSYARRIIGHKYYPFMNYQMPEHVYKDADPRLKRLLGFLPTGAYG